MKKILTEELDRIKLMMTYNPKHTLIENKILNEQLWKAVAEDLGKIVAKDETTVLKSLENAANDGLINLKNMKTEAGVTLTKMSEVLEALKAGTLGPSGTGQVAKGLFLKGSTSEMRIAGAEAITGMGKFAETFAGKSKGEIVAALEQSGKWSKADAEVLADTYLKKGKKPPIKIEPEPVVEPPPVNPPKPKWWQSSWDWLTKTKWGRRIMVAGGLLAAYLLWKKFFGDDDDLPICLKNLVKDENEFQNFLKTGYVVYQGVYKFYTGGKVILTTPDGTTTEGKWVFENNKINMDFNGVKRSISCDGTIIPPVPPEPTGGRGRYRECSGFPYNLYCKSDDIAKVQECLIKDNPELRADRALGPKTKTAIEKAGYSVPLTKEDFDKIMAKCGKSNVDNTEETDPFAGEQSLEIETGETGGTTTAPTPEPPAEG